MEKQNYMIKIIILDKMAILLMVKQKETMRKKYMKMVHFIQVKLEKEKEMEMEYYI